MKRCCCSSPCSGGCCGADEHPAWHPRSLGNASALPHLLGRLGKAFPLATQNKVGSVLELRASPGWGGVLAGEPVPSLLVQAKRQKMLLGPAGCPHSCPVWAAPAHSIAPCPGQEQAACPEGLGWDRRGQGLTTAEGTTQENKAG